MEKIIGNYYGLDWLAMIMTLSFLFSAGNKKAYSFIMYGIANVAWIFVNIQAEIWAGVVLNICLIILNVRAYRKWNHETDANQQQEKV